MTFQPQISWLFLDRTSLKQSEAWLKSEQKPGAIDQLGLGVARDDYSEKLFPYTTVLHTRVKYLFFLMDQYYHHYSKGLPFDKAEMEEALCYKLIKAMRSDENKSPTGIIGSHSNGRPATKSTDIYWSMFRELGLVGEYQRFSDFESDLHEHYALKIDQSHNNTDDQTQTDEDLYEIKSRLDHAFESMNDTFSDLDHSNWHLSRDQGILLRDSFLEKAPESILTHLLINPQVDLPDNWFDLDGLIPHHLSAKLKEAEYFSFIAGGMNLFFSYILKQRLEEEDLTSIGSRVEDFKAMKESGELVTLPHLHHWLESYRTKYKDEGYTLHISRDPRKVSALVDKFIKLVDQLDDGYELNQELIDLLIRREISSKPTYKRKSTHLDLIKPTGDLYAPSLQSAEWSSFLQFHFRWGTAAQLIEDVRDAIAK